MGYLPKEVSPHPRIVVFSPVKSLVASAGEGKHMCAIKGVKISSLIVSIAKSL